MQRKKQLYWHSLLGTIQVIEQTFIGVWKSFSTVFIIGPNVGVILYHYQEQLRIWEYRKIPEKLQEHSGITVPFGTSYHSKTCG